LERAGHQVCLYQRNNFRINEFVGVKQLALVPNTIWSVDSRREFAALLKREKADLVHVHNTFMAISPSIYSVCSDRGIPVVQTLHNFRLLCPAGNFYRDGIICKECVDQSLLRSVRHGCYRNSRKATAVVALMLAFHRALDTWSTSVTRFIVLTEFAKRTFIAAGFPSEKFVVKPNFAGSDPGERIRAGEYAAFIGRIEENKGLRVLLNAWKELHEQYPLHIVGDGPDLSTLQAEARESRLSGIIFRGRLLREEVIETVKGARFLIVPSTLYEGLPMCVVESFASGTPVLCSRLGGLAEIVQQHLTGLHFNPGDPHDLARTVEWAWNNPGELSRMGRAARTKYETDYTAEKNYSLLMEIYQQAMSTCASRRHLPLLSRPAISNPLIRDRMEQRSEIEV
jgi:glycosyltransferase involved in cell wall biosynthesis